MSFLNFAKELLAFIALLVQFLYYSFKPNKDGKDYAYSLFLALILLLSVADNGEEISKSE